MLVSSLVSLVASFVLSVEAWVLAGNPNAIFACDISSKLSCGKVASSWQAHVLGFPNAFLGLVFEPAVMVIAVLGLLGVVLPRRVLLGAQVVYSVALVFAYWLFYQSVTSIHALCPWCVSVTFATTMVWTSMTRVNLLDGALRLPVRVRAVVMRALAYGADVAVVIAVWTGLGIVVINSYL